MTNATSTQAGQRLAGQTIIVTGAAGNLGSVITRYLLREGAQVAMTGRNADKLNAFADTLVEEGFERDTMLPLIGDCADPSACRRIVDATVERFGSLNVLVNNAGGAGPKQTLANIPFSDAEARSLGESETMLQATMNLLCGPWNMARAAAPEMASGGAIINVSTIFSRTAYFGRIPYVVPKSGLNALSRGLATELGAGEKGIRVNTLFPGPIESERIDTVFAAMDELQEQPSGSTSKQFRDLMIVRRPDSEGKLDFRYPKPHDIAATILFLSSPESAALSGHAFEVTHGMAVPAQSRAKLVSWPDNRLVDLAGRCVLILGGQDVDEAMTFAQRNRARGAEVVLAFRSLKAVGHARAKSQEHGYLQLQHVDPLRAESMDRLFQLLDDQYGRLDSVIVLPASPNGESGYALSTATDDDIREFVEDELVASVAFAAGIAHRIEKWEALAHAPAITFVSNTDDGYGNRLNEIKRAAIEALIRVWRNEADQSFKAGQRPWTLLPNQIVRFDNSETDNLEFAADWTATLGNRVRKMDPINLWIPKSILRATGKSATPMSIQRVLAGLHAGKTAVITGGSLGIGMQLGRYLALAGARVLLSARSPGKLESARQDIVDELRGIGYPEPEQRVLTLSGIDVGDESALNKLFEHALAIFGDVDFLINNAGISGAEEMVVDMSLEAWERTQQANLVSNYSLIRKFAPRMKTRGSGRVLNVSSYFGGEKYLAVAYPNRADYSVSKAGQRSLAEILSRHLGPEIQINAMAPGPVDGARLRGLGGTPGLFARRGRLILENKRLNQVHAAIIECDANELGSSWLEKLARNEVSALAEWADAPEPLRRVFQTTATNAAAGNAASFLLNADLAAKLMNRLMVGGIVTREQSHDFLAALKPAPESFFDDGLIRSAAEKIEAGIINRLHLHKMPTDEQVALSTVFSLADDIVSGETFHPSGGLKFDRSVTEGELMLPPGSEDLARLADRNIVLIGPASREHMAAVAQGYARQGVASITLLTRSDEGVKELEHQLGDDTTTEIDVRVVGDDLEAGMDEVRARRQQIDAVVSMSFERLPLNALAGNDEASWKRALSVAQFEGVVREQLTHHFRVARRAALYPNCQIVLLTPDTSRASTREEFALALFVKNSLHALTVTLGVEGERLPTAPAVNQVQLTRRARTEEPDNDQELAEEMERVVHAVLQCSVPAPSPRQSRYLARIFRGNAVTV